jgi:two-component system response regulator FlrC
LRERTQDIAPLAKFLLARYSTAAGRATPALTTAAEQKLISHSWPGNVRELDNVVQRALILANGGAVDAAQIHFETNSSPAAVLKDSKAATDGVLGDDLKSRERRLILDALRTARGSRKIAAAKLGISARTLRYKLARMRDEGVEVPDAYGAWAESDAA